MNKEIKVAVGLLVCLVGLIVYMEMSDKGEGEENKVASTEVTPANTTTQPLTGMGTETGLVAPEATTAGNPKADGSSIHELTGVEATTHSGTMALNTVAGQTSALGQDSDLTITEGAANSEILSSGGEKATNSGYDPNREIPKTYVIKKGDVLSKIAHNILGKASYTKLILEKNPELDPDHIVPGMELTMPTKEELGDRPTKAKSAAQVGATGDNSYRVKKGDSLYSISRKVLGSPAKVKEIIELNPELDPQNLHVGQTLILPPQ